MELISLREIPRDRKGLQRQRCVHAKVALPLERLIHFIQAVWIHPLLLFERPCLLAQIVHDAVAFRPVDAVVRPQRLVHGNDVLAYELLRRRAEVTKVVLEVLERDHVGHVVCNGTGVLVEANEADVVVNVRVLLPKVPVRQVTRAQSLVAVV